MSTFAQVIIGLVLLSSAVTFAYIQHNRLAAVITSRRQILVALRNCAKVMRDPNASIGARGYARKLAITSLNPSMLEYLGTHTKQVAIYADHARSEKKSAASQIPEIKQALSCLAFASLMYSPRHGWAARHVARAIGDEPFSRPKPKTAANSDSCAVESEALQPKMRSNVRLIRKAIEREIVLA